MNEVQLTQQEVSLMLQVVGQLNINPAAEDAPLICSLVHSIKQKLGVLMATQQPSTPEVETKAAEQCVEQ